MPKLPRCLFKSYSMNHFISKYKLTISISRHDFNDCVDAYMRVLNAQKKKQIPSPIKSLKGKENDEALEPTGSE
jgi:hypothetical protein